MLCIQGRTLLFFLELLTRGYQKQLNNRYLLTMPYQDFQMYCSPGGRNLENVSMQRLGGDQQISNVSDSPYLEISSSHLSRRFCKSNLRSSWYPLCLEHLINMKVARQPGQGCGAMMSGGSGTDKLNGEI